MNHQRNGSTSGSLSSDPGTYHVTGDLLNAKKSKKLYSSILLRLITGSPLLFDMIFRCSEYIEAEIPYLSLDQHTELLHMFYVLGTTQFIIERGIHFGWKYQDIEELRANLTQGLDGFFHVYTKYREATSPSPNGGESTLTTEMQHAGKYLEQFTSRYHQLTKRQQGPFAGCTHCPAKCIYRLEVKSLLTQKNCEWISVELSNQTHTTETERYHSVAWAAINIVKSWEDTPDLAGVAYCTAIHAITSPDYTAHEQGLLANNLQKHFFEGNVSFACNIQRKTDQ